jgi:CBS-domain-containing membrane protein
MAAPPTPSHCVVYDGHGETSSLTLPPSKTVTVPARTPTIAADVPITEIMSRDMVCARTDLPVDVLARLLVHNHIGCIPIVDQLGRPLGMVTKSDLVEQLDAAVHARSDRRAAMTRTAGDVMMPLALSLDDRATVAQAAMMMVMEDLHHVMVVSQAKSLIGIVSAKDIVRWLVQNDGLVSEDASAARIPPDVVGA